MLSVTFAPVPRVSPGDLVAVVAPAGPFDRESFEKGLAVLSRRYRERHDAGLFAAERYLAGSDGRRLAELQGAYDDQGVRAVFAARGGYGAMRLLESFRVRRPVPLIGFSDLTALHAVAQKAGHRSLHAPVLTQLGTQSAAVVERLFATLESPAPAPAFQGLTMLVPGAVEGPLLGGNLSVFTRLLGTPYLPPLDGAVLFLEDVGERPYRLDRMWTHLRLAGVFQRVRGVVLGDFTSCEEKDGSHTSAEVLASLAKETGLPCASGLPVGHGAVNVPLVLGARVRLDATRGELTPLEGLVA